MSTHQYESRKPGKSLRGSGVLNIAELAQRGGLPSNVTAYTMDEDEEGSYIRSLGNSTTVVNECVIVGLALEVGSARHYASIRRRVSAQVIATNYRNVGAFYSQREIQQKIIDGSSLQDNSELAQEIYDRHEELNPELQNWRPRPIESQAARANRRQMAIDPLLRELDLSRSKWAQDAKVNWHTVRNFMQGKTTSLAPSTCRSLAHVLGLEPKDFPL